MIDQNIITARIEEVKAEAANLRQKLEACETEISDLETTAKVVARLSREDMGGPKSKFPGIKRRSSAPASSKPDGLPTMPELIKMALRQSPKALTPREVADVIQKNWWPEVDPQKIGSIVWRMHNRDDIVKVEGTSTYRLPQTNEPPDRKLGGNTSEGSLFETHAKGREAGPGGGP